MRRQSTGARVEITSRDLEIFKLLNRYRYLRSSFIHAFVGGDLDRFKRRLGLLYHEGGYLNRPSHQWQFYNARYQPTVYEIKLKAEDVLRNLGLIGETTTWLSRGRQGAHRQFSHSLMICDIVASIELGIVDDPALRFIGWQEILARAPEATKMSQNPFAIPVTIAHTFEKNGKTHRAKTHLVPDAVFGIEYAVDGKKSYRFFALEADRRSMPVHRNNLQENSYLKKLLGYREIAAEHIYKSHLGLPNMMVLTVTTNARHMTHIMELLEKLTGGARMFCFKTLPSLGDMETAPEPTPAMLTLPWKRVGHEDFLINKA